VRRTLGAYFLADVFISYVRGDKPIAEEIASCLEDAQLSVWWDRHIRAGTDFSAEIEREIEAARVVVVLWSSASHDSQWVRDEAAYARDHKKLIPVRLDSSEPPLGFRQVQSLSLHTGNGTARAQVISDLVLAARRAASDTSLLLPQVSKPQIRSRRFWAMSLLAVLLAAVGWLIADRDWFAPRTESTATAHASLSGTREAVTPPPLKSIAVLPFRDISEAHDQDFLAEGIAEEILNQLAKAPDLLVPARTSSFYFKDTQTKIADIARELGVAHVLEGSVRRAGDRLRVTAQLIRADTGYHLWSETYNRELRDVFAVQDDIANAVAEALQIQLMGGILDRRKGGTQNLEAYLLYLRGVAGYAQNTPSSLDDAIEHLEAATALDPNYGLAWVMLGTVLGGKSDIGSLPPQEGYERSREMMQKALAVSPDLARAHAGLQYIHRTFDWDWRAAEAEGRRALAIDPTEPGVPWVSGMVSFTLGRGGDAVQQLQSALVRDPLNPMVVFNLGMAHLSAGQFADAEHMFRRVIEMEPEFYWAHSWLGKSLLAQGDAEAALEVALERPDEAMLFFLPVAFDAVGRKAEADDALREQIARGAEVHAYNIAVTYAYRGERDLALQWLERAYAQRDQGLPEIHTEPLFKSIATDPGFKAFLRKMNLPEKNAVLWPES
jgi:TolB-like protein/Flp pilus assembly protein TadD